MKTVTALPASPAGEPWWRFPIVWLAFGGPAVVVVASFVTLGLTLKYPDQPLHTTAESAHAPAEETPEPAGKDRH